MVDIERVGWWRLRCGFCRQGRRILIKCKECKREYCVECLKQNNMLCPDCKVKVWAAEYFYPDSAYNPDAVMP